MIVVDLIITVLAYMLIPFMYFYILKKKMVKRKIILFNFVNSFVVMLIFMAIRQYISESNLYSGAPSFLYWCINNFIYTRYSFKNDEEIDKIKKEKKASQEYNHQDKKIKKNKMQNKKRKSIIITLVISFLFIFSISFNIYFLISNNDLKIENEEMKSDLRSLIRNFNSLIGDKNQRYVENKLRFIDNNIVFVIDGYGNYYSNYDCMLQRVGNNNFKYWAYNKESAQSRGYKEYICN